MKHGDLVHVGGTNVVLRRLQSAAASLSQATTKDKELGNYQTVATTKDTPDLSFTMDSREARADMEKMLTGLTGAARTVSDAEMVTGDSTLTSATAAFTAADKGRKVIVAGAGAAGAPLVALIASVTSATEVELDTAAATDVTDADLTVNTGLIDLAKALPIDVLGQFKAGKTAANADDVEASAALPHLTVESVSYNFSTDSESTINATLKGDGIFWSNASSFAEEFAGTGAAGQQVTLAHNALPWNGDKVNGTRYALNLRIKETGQRLAPGLDYTEEATGAGTPKAVTITVLRAVPANQTLVVVYQSDTVASYPQATFNDNLAVRPASVKGKDIEIRVGGLAVTDRWSKTQSVTIDWSRQGTQQKELGSAQTEQEFSDPEVKGQVVIRSKVASEFIDRLREITGVSNPLEVIGATDSVALPLTIIIHSPADGRVIKTLHIDDARFSMPGYNGQVDQDMTFQMDYESDSGSLEVWDGVKPGVEVPASLLA